MKYDQWPYCVTSLFRRALLLVCALIGAPLVAKPAADGWITYPNQASTSRPIVLHFRRTFSLQRAAKSFPIIVTADNRFILYVDGQRIAAGPSTGTLNHWRTTKLDLARYLKSGRHVIAAVVWNVVKLPPKIPANATLLQQRAIEGGEIITQTAQLFQQSASTGFRFFGMGSAAFVSTDNPGWRVKPDAGHTMANGFLQLLPNYYVAGAPETITAAKADWDWYSAAESGDDWVDAVPAPEAMQRTLTADRLPLQKYAHVAAGKVVRTNLIGGESFPAKPVIVPANSHIKLLIQRDAMVSAYPELAVSGGANADIKLTYAEALYDAKSEKGDRDLIADRKVKGLSDTFKPDGKQRSFAPLWWRVWRYAEIDVTTASQPLTLERFSVFETEYPFVAVGHFQSNDAELNNIWRIGWRTALIDAHETYMDSAYWEQLQYTGDTRLQMLISYAVSGDTRLAEQAIDAFAETRTEGGLIQGAAPSRGDNAIATFSLLWIGMLHDWWMEQPNTDVLKRNLPRMREIIAWFSRWRGPHGLLIKNPQWNFIDWVGQSAGDRTIFPSYSVEGESCLMSVSYVGALHQAEDMERVLGSVENAQADHVAANEMAKAIRDRCWVKDSGLFADNPDGKVFSQQMNALAVLYDVVPRDQGRSILSRISVPGKGIDAPEGMFPSSYYFSWYLIHAFEHVGLTDHYPEMLQTWRDLRALHYTTWPESRGKTRSDTHAWSAHPTADMLGLIAGIQSAAPGYAAVRIAPSLGSLKSLDATAMTPKGLVHVRYRMGASAITAEIERPQNLPGDFYWQGSRYPLRKAHSRFILRLAR